MVLIKKAKPENLNQISKLFDDYRQFYEQDSDLSLAASFIEARLKNNDSVILFADDEDNNIVGFCQLYPSFCSVAAAPIYVLYDLFVLPAARRGGYARALLEDAARQARDDKKIRMDLSTAKTNAAAQALYESLGWKRDDAFFTYTLSLQR